LQPGLAEVTPATAGGGVIAAEPGAVAHMACVDFGREKRARRFSVQIDAATEGTIDVRLDAADASPIASLTVVPSAGLLSEQFIDTPAIHGVHDVFLTFRGEGPFGTLKALSFRAAGCSAQTPWRSGDVCVASCGANKARSGATCVDAAAVQPAHTCSPVEPVTVRVVEPLAAGVVVVSPSSTLELVAVVGGEATGATWQLGYAAATAAVVDGTMSASIPLTLPESKLTVSATGPGEQRASDVVLVGHPGPTTLAVKDVASFSQLLFARGASALVSVNVPLDAATVPGAVELSWKLPDGSWSASTLMADDGASTSGDSTAGDGVYSATVTAPTTQEGTVIAYVGGGGATKLPVGSVRVVAPLDPVKVEEALSTLSRLGDIAAADSDRQVAALNILAEAEADPAVAFAAIPDGSTSVSVRFKAGFTAIVSNLEEGLRGSPVGNRKTFGAKMFGNGTAEHAPIGGEEIDALAKAWQDEIAENGQRDISVRTLVGPAVTVEELRQMTTYGLVAIASHGEYYVKAGETYRAQTDADVTAGATKLGSSIYTETPASPANMAKYDALLTDGALVLVIGRNGKSSPLLGFTDRFIDALPGNFPNSLAYFGACVTAGTANFWASLRAKGAAGFVGYNDYVKVEHATAYGTELFQCLVRKRKPNGDPMLLGDCIKPNTPQGEVVLVGNEKYTCAGALTRLKKMEADLRANFDPKKLSDTLPVALLRSAIQGSCGPAYGVAVANTRSGRVGSSAGGVPNYAAAGSLSVQVGLPCPPNKPHWKVSTQRCIACPPRTTWDGSDCAADGPPPPPPPPPSCEGDACSLAWPPAPPCTPIDMEMCTWRLGNSSQTRVAFGISVDTQISETQLIDHTQSPCTRKWATVVVPKVVQVPYYCLYTDDDNVCQVLPKGENTYHSGTTTQQAVIWENCVWCGSHGCSSRDPGPPVLLGCETRKNFTSVCPPPSGPPPLRSCGCFGD
jgi:hypothetical protein